METINKFSLLLFIFLFSSCKHEELFGSIYVSGKVIDIISGAPIPNAVVSLEEVYWKHGFGGGPDGHGFYPRDTTDSEGNYSFPIIADGQYEFNLMADPKSELYVPPFYGFPSSNSITTLGLHTIDISCDRSATARITLLNIAPIDTPSFISAKNNLDQIVLYNFYRDTVLYLKMYGTPEFPNEISFFTNDSSQYLDVVASPWDTVSMKFQY